MSRTYVVGFDESKASAAAVAFAAELAEATGAELLVAHVMNYDARRQRASNPAYERALEDEADNLLAGLKKVTERSDLRTKAIPNSSPAHGLQELAEDANAAMIAVGHSHRGRLSSVPERLLHGSSCSVLVVSEDTRAEGVRVVGVAFDGGPESVAAAREAERIALECGAALRLLIVDEPIHLTPAIPEGAVLSGHQSEWLDERLEAMLDELSPDVRAESKLLKGDAGKAIADACEEGIDLLVCGSRGYGPIAAVLLGSISHQLVRVAPCPVLVVPRPNVEEAERASEEPSGERQEVTESAVS